MTTRRSSNSRNNTNKEHLQLIRRVQENLTKKFKVYSGANTDGDEYESIEDMWISELVIVAETTPTNNNTIGGSSWYTKSHEYWQDDDTMVPATTDGMLGGFAALTERDLIGSRQFVEDVLEVRSQGLKARLLLGDGDANADAENDDSNTSMRRRKTRCCECGAGIGRVSKGLLLPLGFEVCDLIETSPRLIGAAPDYIGDASARCRFICMGLQDFEPAPDMYDVIWIQWVIGYLTDYDLVQFFKRMAESLRQPDGLIFLKDNVCKDQAFLVDRDDSSLTRSLPYLLALVEESGLRVVIDETKRRSGGLGFGGDGSEMLRYPDDFPEAIFPVPMMALELDV